jgi:hypothetical protein
VVTLSFSQRSPPVMRASYFLLMAEISQADQRRAEQREEARPTMDATATELKKDGSLALANSDAVALATYLQALGLSADADRVNKLLVLLATVVIECGGALR